jgi:hypothetical protein
MSGPSTRLHRSNVEAASAEQPIKPTPDDAEPKPEHRTAATQSKAFACQPQGIREPDWD